MNSLRLQRTHSSSSYVFCRFLLQLPPLAPVLRTQEVRHRFDQKMQELCLTNLGCCFPHKVLRYAYYIIQRPALEFLFLFTEQSCARDAKFWQQNYSKFSSHCIFSRQRSGRNKGFLLLLMCIGFKILNAESLFVLIIIQGLGDELKMTPGIIKVRSLLFRTIWCATLLYVQFLQVTL